MDNFVLAAVPFSGFDEERAARARRTDQDRRIMTHTPAFRALIKCLQQARYTNQRIAGEAVPRPARPGEERLTRRRLLKGVGATAMAVGAGGLAGPAGAWLADQAQSPRVAVIGAGIAGLSAAWHLKQQGVAATVYEAGSRLGGRMQSATGLVADGIVTDLGGSYINSNHTDLIDLAGQVGVRLFSLPTYLEGVALRGTACYLGGRDIAEAELAETLRAFAAQLDRDSRALDEDWDRVAPALDALSVAAYLERHRDTIASPVIHQLIIELIRSEYGVEPADSSVLQLLWLLPTVEGESVDLHSLSDEAFMAEGGSGTIIAGLAAALADSLRVGKRLVGLREEGLGHRLVFADGSHEDSDVTILAVPQAALRSLQLAVDLPPVYRSFIDEVEFGRNEKTFAGFHGRPWRQQAGFAAEAWTDLGASVVWDEAIRQPDRSDGVLTFFHGGNETWFLNDFGAEASGRRMVERLDPFVPKLAAAANGRFARSVWTRMPGLQGSYTNLKPGQYTKFLDVFTYEGATPAESQYTRAGRLIFAGEQFSDAYYAYMNGGAETGRIAAAQVAEMIGASAR